MTQHDASGPLGIVAGGGTLPASVADAAIAQGRDVYIVAIGSSADEGLRAYSHTWLEWVDIGSIFNKLRDQGCQEVVIVGGVDRPDLSDIKLSLRALKNVPLVISLVKSGDGDLLGSIVKAFEDRGFIVRGADDIAPELVMTVGPLGRVKPDDSHQFDIDRAFGVIEALGPFDVGQAVIVSQGHVLAIEAAEGTDAILKRCAGLETHQRKTAKKPSGVLVKRPKPGQERRIDLPTIGPETVRNAAKARLAGIALSAGAVLVAERETVIAEADKHGLFISGFDLDEGQ